MRPHQSRRSADEQWDGVLQRLRCHEESQRRSQETRQCLTRSQPKSRSVPDVLSLCDKSGVWSDPWASAGYDVLKVDLQNGQDVRLLEHMDDAPRVILAAPPCTEFASSGARWWAQKGEQALRDALAVVDACLRAVAIYRPRVWALENPSGRLSRYLGPPTGTFQPADYGDPYTKLTLLWGDFTMPQKNPVEATLGSMMHRVPPSQERQNIRSKTPGGFSEAFYMANRWLA